MPKKKSLKKNTKSKKKRKKSALLLFSGGLDSLVAEKMLRNAGVDVTALVFKSYFFGSAQARKAADREKIKLLEVDISKDHLKIVKNPRFGRGAASNPCLDCPMLMLKAAKAEAKKRKFDIIATGDVLGQRPMTQTRDKLELIDRKTGLSGKVLRPLSAKLLPQTEYEKMNLIDRNVLGEICGRTRKSQMASAEQFGIAEYPSPAGGCILTDKEYSKNLHLLLLSKKNPDISDFTLISSGRKFWKGRVLTVVGRNYEENQKLKNLARKGDYLVEIGNVPSPVVLVRFDKRQSVLKFAQSLASKYAKKLGKEKPEFEIKKY